ncbi:MAG: DNA-processing protein DprA [Chloroflexi bacterium]|nr:DNA-processing protein DprA [Chloroflexota bacterium]
MMTRLLDHFESPEAVLCANKEDLLAITGVGEILADQILAADMDQIVIRLEQWQAEGVRVLTWLDDDYPVMLRDVDDAPPSIFMRGNWPPLETRTVAIIGTRQPSTEALAAAFNLGQQFAERGYTVVSGLAVGIDTQAHNGALRVDGGQTVGMLGCGLQRIYPPQNQVLARKIMDNGALFSELPPEEEVSSPALVARNRLITGLSRAVIVVEAGAKSGALHAARFARVQGRTLGAVGYAQEGNYMLIKDGAIFIPPDLSNVDTLLEILDDEG